MKPKPCPDLEKSRLTHGLMASTPDMGNNGAFIISTPDGVCLKIIASDGMGWEHVSVSPYSKKRCPTWEEMCWVKDLFWGSEEVVIQYHPARSEYVTLHDYCLHLWKPIGVDLPTPPAYMVGPKKRRHA